MLQLSGSSRAARCLLLASVAFFGCGGDTASITTPPPPRPAAKPTPPEVVYNETIPIADAAAHQGGCEFASARIEAGNALMNFTTTTSTAWIYASPASGSLRAKAAATLAICLAPNELPLGDNTAEITVSAVGYADRLIRATFRLE
jgi:hypothetical protein